MTALWLSRARLRRDTAATGSLARLLVPEGEGPRVAAGHRLVWTLFAAIPWCHAGRGRASAASAMTW